MQSKTRRSVIVGALGSVFALFTARKWANLGGSRACALSLFVAGTAPCILVEHNKERTSATRV